MTSNTVGIAMITAINPIKYLSRHLGHLVFSLGWAWRDASP